MGTSTARPSLQATMPKNAYGQESGGKTVSSITTGFRLPDRTATGFKHDCGRPHICSSGGGGGKSGGLVAPGAAGAGGGGGLCSCCPSAPKMPGLPAYRPVFDFSKIYFCAGC